jgi:hypothetical protein
MIVGSLMLNLSFGYLSYLIIAFSTIFIYLPLLIKIILVQKNITLNKFLNLLLTTMLIIAQLLSVIGCLVMAFGVLAALLFKIIAALLAVIPLLVSAVMYAIVSFKSKNKIANIITAVGTVLLIIGLTIYSYGQSWL